MKYEIPKPFQPSPEVLAISVQDLIAWTLRGEIELPEFEDCYRDLQETQARGWIPIMELILNPNSTGAESSDEVAHDTQKTSEGRFSFNDISFYLGATGLAQVVVLAESDSGLNEVTLTPWSQFSIHATAPEVVISSYATV